MQGPGVRRRSSVGEPGESAVLGASTATHDKRIVSFILRRLLVIPLSVFVVVSAAFALVNLLPGNPAITIAGGFVTEERVAEIEEALGLNRSLGSRYIEYVKNLSKGDLGNSYYTDTPIIDELIERLPNSIELVVPAVAVAAGFGLILGGIAAYARRRVTERVSRLMITLTQSIPDFLLALILIYLVFFLLGWAPAPVGRLEISESKPEQISGFPLLDSALRGEWKILISLLHHMMLPVFALGFVYSAYFAKISRTTLAESLGSKQVEFARACGLSEWQVFRYAFLVARTPLLTYTAMLFGTLLGGAAIVETIFSWRGMGQWALEAMLKVDLPAIQGFVLVTGLSTLLIYLILDIIVMILDPRIKYP